MKMKKTTLRKLTLARETLRNLEEQGLRHAAGGASGGKITFCLACITIEYSNCDTC
jgi:hypothetical protein